MLETIERLNLSVGDEPQGNDSYLPSADAYYSTPSTSNRIIITKISSQISNLTIYYEEDELSLELEAWDALSDEALVNFEAMLD
jgi:hypothetical protein